MSKMEYVYINPREEITCNKLSLQTDNLDIGDESQPSYDIKPGNMIHRKVCNDGKNSFNDSGFGNVSEEYSSTSSNSSDHSNSPETAKNFDDDDFFEFLYKKELSKTNEVTIKYNKINALNTKNSVANSLKNTHSYNGYRTGRDSLPTSDSSNLCNSPENESNDFFDFWSKNEESQINEVSKKADGSDGLSIESSFSNLSSNTVHSPSPESKMTITDLLCFIDTEDLIIPNKKVSIIHSNPVLTGIDIFLDRKNIGINNDSNTCGLSEYINAQGENKSTSASSDDSIDNVHSDFSSISVNSDDSSHSVKSNLSDLLTCIELNNDRLEKNKLENSSQLFNGLDQINTSKSEFGKDSCKDYNSFDSVSNTNTSLSDMLSSICFEDDHCNEKCLSSLTHSKADFSISCDVAKQNNINLPQKLSINLDSPNFTLLENEINDLSLASLAEKHLASKKAENEINVNLFSHAGEHLTTSQDWEALNLVTGNLSRSSENGDHIKLSENFECSGVKSLAENTKIKDNISMLDLLSSLSINDVYCEKTQFAKNLDNISDDVYKSTKFMNDGIDNENKSDCMEVDLTTCLKSAAESLSIASKNIDIVKEEEEGNYAEIFNTSAFHYPLGLSHSENKNAMTTNKETLKNKSNQSLFAKSISCKPRKNFPALFKVWNLRKNLCNHSFQPFTNVYFSPSENLSKTVFVDRTNSCIIASCGIRNFGP